MADILDSRDLQKRLDDLEFDLDQLEEAVTDAQDGYNELDPDSDEQDIFEDAEELLTDTEDTLKEFKESDEFEELEELRIMVNEIPEWQYGATLINEDYWEEYVEEMLKDIGDIPSDLPNYLVINWESTAENIKADYSEIEYDGETYYYRNC